jgi:Telomerase ribonucleoprotein complex - RNA binding domain
MAVGNDHTSWVHLIKVGGETGAGAGKLQAAQHHQQQKMLLKWVKWILGDLCLTLLRSHFYVTEGEAQRQVCLYYRYT